MKQTKLISALLFSFLFTSHGYGMKLPPDSCYARFQKTYLNSKQDVSNSVIESADSNYLDAGATSSAGAGGLDALLQKLHRDGSVIWSSVIGGSADDMFYSVLQAADGGFMAVGYSKSYGGGVTWGSALMVKTDAEGNVLWSKIYNDQSIYGSTFYEVLQTSNGSYVCTGASDYAPGTSDMFVVKTDSAGNTQWSETFDSGSTDFGTGLATNGDTLLVGGDARGSYNFYDGIFMALNLNNGNYLWGRRIDIESGNNWFGSVFKHNNHYSIRSQTTDDWSDIHPRTNIISYNSNGSLLSLFKVLPAAYRELGAMYPTHDGGWVVNEVDIKPSNLATQLSDTADSHIYKIDSNGILVWDKVVEGPGAQVLNRATEMSDHSIVLSGISTPQLSIPDSSNLLLVKVDSLGLIPECINQDIAISVDVPSYTFDSLFAWSAKTLSAMPSITVTVNQTFADFADHNICFTCTPNLPTSLQQPATSYGLTCLPNPMNDAASIQFTLLQNEIVTLYLFDISGRKIATLADGSFSSGTHSLTLSSRNLPSGIYLLQMLTVQGIISQKLVIQ